MPASSSDRSTLRLGFLLAPSARLLFVVPHARAVGAEALPPFEPNTATSVIPADRVIRWLVAGMGVLRYPRVFPVAIEPCLAECCGCGPGFATGSISLRRRGKRLRESLRQG
jgi:hypothetical protein